MSAEAIPDDLDRPATDRRRFLETLALTTWLAARPATAALPGLRIVAPNDPTPAARETLAALTRRFPAASIERNTAPPAERREPSMNLALGIVALQRLLAEDPIGPVLALLCSSESFIEVTSNARSDRQRLTVGAIFAEASPMHQMTLIRMIFMRRVTVGVLLSARTAHVLPVIQAAAQSADLDLEVRRLSDGESPIRALMRLSAADVLLAVPDRTIFNAENIQALLEATYRRGQAVVGFSSALVRAGSLASVYSTVDEVVAETSTLIERATIGQPIPAQHPSFWRVAVNDSVARSLNIPVTNEARSFANPVR